MQKLVKAVQGSSTLGTLASPWSVGADKIEGLRDTSTHSDPVG